MPYAYRERERILRVGSTLIGLLYAGTEETGRLSRLLATSCGMQLECLHGPADAVFG